MVTFADDNTVLGLIRNNDEMAYRDTVSQLAAWCARNNLELNVNKTVEMVISSARTPPPLLINSSAGQVVNSVKFLGLTITSDLKWETHDQAHL
ncbi:unnamed protein product [Menidia menidia]|uniref:(Atlantic silverside) hypothetical protein n=1 Tax=Menidia menidia TaxID=238744 RepID=A0A8S4APQ3_9TELE|nr:unnamed protein product [Menidia menidia]